MISLMGQIWFCFAANKLVLNLDKTTVIKLIINNQPQCTLSIGQNKVNRSNGQYKASWFTN